MSWCVSLLGSPSGGVFHCRCEPDLYDKARMQDRLSSSTNAPVLLQLKEGTQVGQHCNCSWCCSWHVLLSPLGNCTRGSR